ncbi:MAG TPA: DUF5654 family protein [Flavobacterium sp.]|nr:DUF5654 family protein [Flavobacterium sp.]
MEKEGNRNKTEHSRRRLSLFGFKTSRSVVAESLTLIINAFGLIAALAWNEAIKGAIDRFFQSDGTLISRFVYAILVTVITVIFAARLARVKDRIKTEE